MSPFKYFEMISISPITWKDPRLFHIVKTFLGKEIEIAVKWTFIHLTERHHKPFQADQVWKDILY